jgi:hemerythrin superfamily protein
MGKLQSLIERIAGRIERARATVADSGVLAALQREHLELACTMSAVLDEARDDKDQETIECRRVLFARVRVQLLAHGAAEEDELYGRLPHGGTAEHVEIEHLLRRIEAMNPNDVGWLPTFATLQMKVEHHVREEESSLFAQAKQLLGEVALNALETAYMAARLRYETTLGRPNRRRIASSAAEAR